MDVKDTSNDGSKKDGSNNNDNGSNNENKKPLPSRTLESPTLATRYAHGAAKLVRSIEKNFYVIIGIIIALFILSILDLLQVHEDLHFSFDPIITVFTAASIVALLFMLHLTIKSKRFLERWADIFERNSIATGINISLGGRTGEEVVHAIAENIQEIGPQLREYISSRDNYNEFFDISIGKDTATATHFDIVIDKDNLKPTENNSYQDLRLAL
ncbi:MAG TPA: hypothetical protein VE130_11985, partial [Nitrososphaeraceae archaeon]|nr:hypothetical protein [Nitrososphaeraceae archaeon]